MNTKGKGKDNSVFEPLSFWWDIVSFNKVVPSVSRVETDPFQQQIETQKFLRESGVQHKSWSPFAEGKNDLFKKWIARLHWNKV